MIFMSFKIFPKPKSKLYYKVFIFHTKNSMYKFRDLVIEDGAKGKIAHRYAAVCSAYPSKANKNQYGIILFTRSSAKKSGIVSHEITHATTYWAKYMHKNIDIFYNKEADEKFAWVLGTLVHQFWKSWYTLPKKFR